MNEKNAWIWSVRAAEIDDASELLEIYTPFVVSEDRNLSDVSFEYEAPSVSEFAQRIKNISAQYPYLVCRRGEKIMGYVYAHPFIPRAAYQWGAEVTIYLAPEAQGCGVGKILYTALEEILAAQGICKAYACITASNVHSVGLHAALGYKIVGEFKNSGFKHGNWLDMVWMGKNLRELPSAPALIKNWHELEAEKIAEILAHAESKFVELN